MTVAARDLPGQPAVAQEDDALRYRCGPRVMGDDDHRLALGAIQVAQEPEHLRARARVQVARRLVGQDELGIGEERPGDRDPLLLASRELRRQVIGAVRQPDPVQQGRCALARCVVRAAGDERGKEHVLLSAQRGQQVEELKHEADAVTPKAGEPRVAEAVVALAGQDDLPRRGRFEGPEEVQHRRLARAGRPHDRDHLAATDLE
jgi:hypothetical protein